MRIKLHVKIVQSSLLIGLLTYAMPVTAMGFMNFNNNECDIVSPRSSTSPDTADAQDSNTALEPSQDFSCSPSFCFNRERLPETLMLDKTDIIPSSVSTISQLDFDDEEFIQTSPILSPLDDDSFRQDFEASTSSSTTPQTAEPFTSSLFTFKDDIIINPSLTTQLQRINDKYQNKIEVGLMRYALTTKSFADASDIGRTTRLIMEHIGDAIASYCHKMDFVKTHVKPKVDNNDFIVEYYFKKLNARQHAIDRSLGQAKDLLVQYDLNWRKYGLKFFSRYTNTVAEFVKKDQVNQGVNTTTVSGHSSLR